MDSIRGTLTVSLFGQRCRKKYAESFLFRRMQVSSRERKVAFKGTVTRDFRHLIFHESALS
jgi:hypothetical protein